jgi:Ca2+-binding RTX toxin-like protein
MKRGLPSREVGAVVACVVTAIVLWAMQSPAVATAAVVSPDPTNPLGLLVQDTLAQNNVMTIRAEPGFPAATLVIEDTGAATTTTAPQCAVVAAQVRCDSTALIGLNVALGDGNDTFHLDETAYALTTIVFTLIAGEGGDDVLVTGSGNDFLFGGPGTNRLEAGAGDDNLSGGPGVDTELGGPGRDRLAGNAGDDHLIGEDGVDQLNGEDGNDELDGGGGDDVAWGGPGDDVVRGGDGNDRLDNSADDPTGALGADAVDGGPGSDVLSGGPQTDPLSADVFAGGAGNDQLSYALRSSPVFVSLDGSPNDGAQGEGDNVAADIELVIGGSGPDTLIGSDGANSFDGGDGDDTIDGRAGADTLQGGLNSSGNDHLLGGDGPDVLRGDAGDDLIEGGAGDDGIFGEGGGDRLFGGDGRDQLAGGPGVDDLHGGDGNDDLYGSDPASVGADGDDKLNGDAGDDRLWGGPGDDGLVGGLGADTINGDDGRDTVSYDGRSARIDVTFDGKPNDGERGERDNVAGDVEDVVGGNRGDALTGDARPNTLDAGPGDDFVRGAAGVDRLLGGRGADVLAARDGVGDDVLCGPGADLAIVDRRDRLRSCDFADRGRRRPRFRTSALVRASGRRVLLSLRGPSAFVAVPGPVEVPLGTTLDARRRAVQVTTAQRPGGRVQRATLRGGRFSVLQRQGRRVTELRLVGGDLATCRAHGANRRQVRRRLRARIDERSPGGFEVQGQHSDGSAGGTTWVTEDRCDGTLTRVIDGTVRVRDRRRGRTIVLHVGEHYLARAGT